MRFSALLLLLTLQYVAAQPPYIPAVPTNTTLSIMSYELMPKLLVQFYPERKARMYADTINRELGARDITQGALVYFSADIDSDIPSTTAPWIALISCDRNATDHSQELDIFTLARNKGARAALLYSSTSETCHLNPVYAHSVSNGEFDIFSTRSLNSARILESQFQPPLGDPRYMSYDSQRLSDSAETINSGMKSQKPITSGYALATLSSNATVASSSGVDAPAGTTSVPTSSNSVPSSPTSVATNSAAKSLAPINFMMLYICLRTLRI